MKLAGPRLIFQFHLEFHLLVVKENLLDVLGASLVQLDMKHQAKSHHCLVVTDDKVKRGQVVRAEQTDALPGVMLHDLRLVFILDL